MCVFYLSSWRFVCWRLDKISFWRGTYRRRFLQILASTTRVCSTTSCIRKLYQLEQSVSQPGVNISHNSATTHRSTIPSSLAVVLNPPPRGPCSPPPKVPPSMHKILTHSAASFINTGCSRFSSSICSGASRIATMQLASSGIVASLSCPATGNQQSSCTKSSEEPV